mgnify:CR=1 FL=1
MYIPDFLDVNVWISLLTLTFLEIVLGVDNIIFISLISGKIEKAHRARVTRIGLMLAMVLRIILLLGISALIAMKKPWFAINWGPIEGIFNGQSIILILGGIFLLYKSTSEIHHKLEGTEDPQFRSGAKKMNFTAAVVQMTLINIVFSFDSILTAVGMTSGLPGALIIMIIAVIISVIIMMLFATPVSNFVNEHPTIQMLGLTFLLLIGFMLILEGSHLAHFRVGEQFVGSVPKGYLYFAIAFSLLVEFFNLKMRKRQQPIQLHGAQEEAVKEGILPLPETIIESLSNQNKK